MKSPLNQRCIAITRATEQQSEARRIIEAEGAYVLDLPAIAITPPDNWEPLDEALTNLNQFQWIVFSSANGVEAIENRLKLIGKSLASRPAGLKIAAIGNKTAQIIDSFGTSADFVPPNFVADSLIQNFPISNYGLRILLPRVQSGGRTIIAEAFRKEGIQVVEVAAYESKCPSNIPKETANALNKGTVDIITFSSGKTAIHTAQLLNEQFGSNWSMMLNGVKLVSIGPQTSRKCIEQFGRVDTEANPHNLEGLINACRQAIEEKN